MVELQLPAEEHEQERGPVASVQLPTASEELPTTSAQLPAASTQLPIDPEVPGDSVLQQQLGELFPSEVDSLLREPTDTWPEWDE